MKGFFKFLGWLFLSLLIIGVVASVALLIFDMELMLALAVGLVTLVGGFLLFILIRAIYRLYVRMKAKAQIKESLTKAEYEENYPKDLGMSSAELMHSLKSRWRKTIRALKKSQLKHKGDPLYVLPWYMIIGRPTSGKSTSLRNSKLLSPGIDLSTHEDGSTLNLEWWLYEEGILIDTAGRYAVPDMVERDRKEWDTLLSMLSRHKQKEPLNGLVLAVAADRLINCTEEELLEEGRQVRMTINSLMEKLEIKVPVYLMVTKCDLVEGFSEWSSYLPNESLMQPMGYLNESESGDINIIIDKGLDTVLDRIKELRLMIMERTDAPDNSLLTLPGNLESIRNGLHTFIATALKGNAYQEAPKFRGLYFSSSVKQEAGVEKGRGAFLHEFFTRVLPRDRGLYESLPSIERIKNATRKYVFGVAGAVTFIAATALFVMYEENFSTLQALNEEYQQVELSDLNTFDARLNAASQLLELVTALDSYKSEEMVPWWLPFGEGGHVDELKQTYVSFFKENILNPVDSPLIQTIDDLDSNGNSVVAGGLIRRINALQARLNTDKDIEVYEIGDDFLRTLNSSVGNDSSTLFHELYLSYLDWSDSEILLAEEKQSLQTALIHLVKRNHGDYNWIIEWTNAQGFANVSLDDFWGGSRKLANPPLVPSAFTIDGYDFVAAFMEEFSLVDEDEPELVEVQEEFLDFYQREYLRSWEEFAERFSDGATRFRDQKEWTLAMERMATADNPYFNFIAMMHEQLGVFPGLEFNSSDSFAYFMEIQNYTSPDAKSNNKALKKATKKALGKLGKVGKLAKKGMKAHAKATKGNKKNPLDTGLDQAVDAVDAYKEALSLVAFNSTLRSQSLSTMKTLFTTPDAPESGDGPMASAWNSVIQLQQVLGRPNSQSRLFWKLYLGPINLAYDFMAQESACELQELWENNVLASLEGVDPNRMGNLIVGEQGVLWNYLQQEAQPFIDRQFKRGYVRAMEKGRTVGIREEFLNLVNQAEEGAFIVGNEFNVTMMTLPSGANPGASVSPYATFLELHCSDSVQVLENYNYPTQHDFNWSLERCGDTILTVEIGQTKLVKEYHGVKGFAKFLKDFQDGRHIFQSSDFPNQEAQLLQNNVRYIDVNYRIFGQEPVIKTLDTVPLTLPTRVASCWSNQSAERQLIAEMERNEEVFFTNLNKDFVGEDTAYYLVLNTSEPASVWQDSFVNDARLSSLDSVYLLAQRSLPGVEMTPLVNAPMNFPGTAYANYVKLNNKQDAWATVESKEHAALYWPNAPEDLKVELFMVKP